METREFEIADIKITQGYTVIDVGGISMSGKHYNVKLVQDGERIIVTGDKPLWGLSLDKGEYNIEEITEDSTHLYKPWPWSKPRLRSNNIVEFKKRINKTYYTDKWVLVSS